MADVSLDVLLAACEPGQCLQGLWITRQKTDTGFEIGWWVTFRDRTGEYQETPVSDSPEMALQACAEVLRGKP